MEDQILRILSEIPEPVRKILIYAILAIVIVLFIFVFEPIQRKWKDFM